MSREMGEWEMQYGKGRVGIRKKQGKGKGHKEQGSERGTVASHLKGGARCAHDGS